MTSQKYYSNLQTQILIFECNYLHNAFINENITNICIIAIFYHSIIIMISWRFTDKMISQRYYGDLQTQILLFECKYIRYD